MKAADKPKIRLAEHSSPKKRAPRNAPRKLVTLAVDAALDKKARDIAVLDMRDVTGVADYFVLCTGDSDLQIKAIADSVRDRIREECDERPWHTEGYGNFKWVLLDYVDVVVHVFDAETRDFYSLERLWGDAPVERVANDTDRFTMAEDEGGRRSGGA